jgi:transposase
MQKWRVVLDKSSRDKITKVLRSKNESMETKKRAQILLDVNECMGRELESTAKIASKRGVCPNTITGVKRRFCEEGIDSALFRKKRETPPTTPKVTGEVEAHIITIACSTVPQGFSRWSMKMIADKIVLDGIIDSISDETVRLVLKKHDLNRI